MHIHSPPRDTVLVGDVGSDRSRVDDKCLALLSSAVIRKVNAWPDLGPKLYSLLGGKDYPPLDMDSGTASASELETSQRASSQLLATIVSALHPPFFCYTRYLGDEVRTRIGSWIDL